MWALGRCIHAEIFELIYKGGATEAAWLKFAGQGAGMHRKHSPGPDAQLGADEAYARSQKYILRSPSSPVPPGSRKVRFAEMGPGAAYPSAAAAAPASTSPTASYGASPQPHPQESPQPAYPGAMPSASAYPYCYYYQPNPYAAYPHYPAGLPAQSQWATMPAQPPSIQYTQDISASAVQPSAIAHQFAPAGPAPDAAAAAGGLQGAHDPRRMHLLAKSVSITVNQGQQIDGVPPRGVDLAAGSAPAGAGPPQLGPHPAASGAAAKLQADQRREALMVMKVCTKERNV